MLKQWQRGELHMMCSWTMRRGCRYWVFKSWKLPGMITDELQLGTCMDHDPDQAETTKRRGVGGQCSQSWTKQSFTASNLDSTCNCSKLNCSHTYKYGFSGKLFFYFHCTLAVLLLSSQCFIIFVCLELNDV